MWKNITCYNYNHVNLKTEMDVNMPLLWRRFLDGSQLLYDYSVKGYKNFRHNRAYF